MSPPPKHLTICQFLKHSKCWPNDSWPVGQESRTWLEVWMPLFWELSPYSERPDFYFSSCMLRYQSWVGPKKLPVAIKIPWPSVTIFTSVSAYDGMHASVFHTRVSKYSNYFCSSCVLQMGSNHENLHTIPRDRFLFSLFLCILKVHWRNWLKKGRAKDCKQTGKLTQIIVYDWNPNVIALRGGEWHQEVLHGLRAQTLIRIMGSHLKIAINVPSGHRCFPFSFNFFSVSMLFSRFLHIPALWSLTRGSVWFHKFVSSHMHRQCDAWRFPELK